MKTLNIATIALVLSSGAFAQTVTKEVKAPAKSKFGLSVESRSKMLKDKEYEIDGLRQGLETKLTYKATSADKITLKLSPSFDSKAEKEEQIYLYDTYLEYKRSKLFSLGSFGVDGKTRVYRAQKSSHKYGSTYSLDFRLENYSKLGSGLSLFSSVRYQKYLKNDLASKKTRTDRLAFYLIPGYKITDKLSTSLLVYGKDYVSGNPKKKHDLRLELAPRVEFRPSKKLAIGVDYRFENIIKSKTSGALDVRKNWEKEGSFEFYIKYTIF